MVFNVGVGASPLGASSFSLSPSPTEEFESYHTIQFQRRFSLSNTDFLSRLTLSLSLSVPPTPARVHTSLVSARLAWLVSAERTAARAAKVTAAKAAAAKAAKAAAAAATAGAVVAALGSAAGAGAAAPVATVSGGKSSANKKRLMAQMVKAAGQRQHWKEAIVLFDQMQEKVHYACATSCACSLFRRLLRVRQGCSNTILGVCVLWVGICRYPRRRRCL